MTFGPDVVLAVVEDGPWKGHYMDAEIRALCARQRTSVKLRDYTKR